MKNITSKGFCDLHTHTIASGHAYSTVTEMAKYASEIGLSGIAITDHSSMMPGTAHIYYFQNLKILPKEMFGIRVLKGMETNIVDSTGRVDESNELLKKMEVVVASLHPPTFDFINIKDGTDAILNAMQNRYVNIIGHPDDSRMEFDREKVVKESIKTNTLLEINATSLNPTGFRKNARELSIKTLNLCKKYNAPIVINSDAHYHEYLGDFEQVFKLLREVEFPYELVANKTLKSTLEFLKLND